MNILAVDDERGALDALVNELTKVFPKAEIHGEMDPFAALEWAEKLAGEGRGLSYIFLAVRMGGMGGLELARRVKSVYPDAVLIFCTAYSEYAFEAFGLFAQGYLLKPVRAEEIVRVLDNMVTDWRKTASGPARDIRVQAFGNFEVFVDGQPLSFGREKARELLAYLVDRHGAAVTTEQIAAVLWEDKPYDRSRKNAVTKTVAALKSALKAAGAEDLLVKSWNHLAVDTLKFRCDAYDFEKWDETAVNSFRGEYMANYSWAEFTTGRYARMDREGKNGF